MKFNCLFDVSFYFGNCVACGNATWQIWYIGTKIAAYSFNDYCISHFK